MTVKERNRSRKLVLAMAQIRKNIMMMEIPRYPRREEPQGGPYHIPIQTPVIIDEATYPPVINSDIELRITSGHAAERAILAGEPWPQTEVDNEG